MSLGRRGGAGCEARMLLGTSQTEMGDGGDPRGNKSHPGGVLETLFGERVVLWVRKAERWAPPGTPPWRGR